MTNKSEIGKIGENLACEYLLNKGYTIIDRNFWKPWGELDIVAIGSDKTLVFVEVKTLQQFGNAANLNPEDNLTAAKLKKLQRIASMYANKCKSLNIDHGWRIDLIAITLIGEKHIISHYENI